MSNDYIFIGCFFGIYRIICKLKDPITKILDYIKVEEKERNQLHKDFDKILSNCYIKKTESLSVSDKIEKEIETIKEMVYFIIKVVEKNVVCTINDRILGFVEIDKFFNFVINLKLNVFITKNWYHNQNMKQLFFISLLFLNPH